MLRRFWCWLVTGHDWVPFYTRDYAGREILVQTCTRCLHTTREVTKP